MKRINQKSKKRCKWEIIHDILQVVKDNNNCPKTRIQQMAYIDWRSFQKYFGLILDKGFISRSTNFSNHYKITENGRKFLEQLNSFENTISTISTISEDEIFIKL